MVSGVEPQDTIVDYDGPIYDRTVSSSTCTHTSGRGSMTCAGDTLQ